MKEGRRKDGGRKEGREGEVGGERERKGKETVKWGRGPVQRYGEQKPVVRENNNFAEGIPTL